MSLPKTNECCGVKPKRLEVQYGYSEKDTEWYLKCRKCQRTTEEKYLTEREAVENWNSYESPNT
jgi:hypothetical protein